MALKKLRRIDVAAGDTLFDEISSHVLSTAWSRGEIEQTARQHPDLIVRRGENVLLRGLGSCRFERRAGMDTTCCRSGRP